MTINELHIVCLKVPYPVAIGVDYELFNKIKALHQIGVKIHLHCFINKTEKETPILQQYCKTIHYYKRTKKIAFNLPFITSSRQNNDLIKKLLADNLPIILEGIHCTAICDDNRFANRNIIIRAHNVEYLYYKGLAKSTSIGLKKIYYYIEAILLQKREKKLAHKFTIACISANDMQYFNEKYNALNAVYVPVFYNTSFNIPEGNGSFCLYHGNLSVAENENAVTWLLQNVFNNIEVPFVIAGRNPSKKLVTLSHNNPHTCIAASPSDAEMNDLITKAQINILPSINATGVKLKILNALYNGRFCITNNAGANGFEEKELFGYANDALGMKKIIAKTINEPFTEAHIAKRKTILLEKYDFAKNAKLLISLFENINAPQQ